MSKSMTLATLVCGALFALALASVATAGERDRFEPAVGCSGKNCWPSYSRADVDTDVWSIQYFLLARGFSGVVANETYDSQTVQAVKNFQRENDLKRTGTVDAQTWRNLILPVKRGDRNNAVRALQVQLNQQYGYNVPNVGTYGPETDRAVRDFQKKNGLKPSDRVDAKTWQKIIATR